MRWSKAGSRTAQIAGALVVGCQALTVFMLVRDGGRVKDLGWSHVQREEARRVLDVSAGGLADGRLAPGDRILAINGDTRLARVFTLHLFPLQPGASYTLRVARGEAGEREVTLRVGVKQDPQVLTRQLTFLVVSLAFSAAGLLVAFTRPGGASDRLFSRSAFATALVLLGSALPSFDLLAPREYAFAILTTALNPLHLAVAFHFCQRFASGTSEGGFWSLLRRLLYALASALCLANTAQRLTFLARPELVIAFADQHPGLWHGRTQIMRVFAPLALAAIFAVIVRNGQLAADSAARRWIGRLLGGFVIGCLPAAAMAAFDAWLRGHEYADLVRTDGFVLLGHLATILQLFVPVACVSAIYGFAGRADRDRSEA